MKKKIYENKWINAGTCGMKQHLQSEQKVTVLCKNHNEVQAMPAPPVHWPEVPY